jgi:hypothetical protein
MSPDNHQNQKTQQSVLTMPTQTDMSAINPAESTSIQHVSEASVLAESYADSLVDELFEDVDRMLDHAVAAPPALSSAYSSVSTLPSSTDEPDSANYADLGADPTADAHTPASFGRNVLRGWGASIDQLLLIAAFASLGITLALWFALHGRQQVAADAPPSSITELAQSGDRAFLDYMTRSLDTIDRKAEVEKHTAKDEGATDQNPLPVAALPSSPPDSLTTGPERVYVPIYQTPQTFAPALTNPQPVPFQAAPQQPPAAPAPSTPAPTATSAAPAPTPPTTASVPNVAPAASHSLVALLQMGDRSAAIFEFDGNARTIQIGEQIGSSGWTLVSVSGDQAVIRRNGEVRSIYNGQSF